jgi:chromate reductase
LSRRLIHPERVTTVSTAGNRLLLICGSLRAGSTNEALLRTVAMVSSEVATYLYDGIARLPHFSPDDDRAPLPPAVVDLRARIATADAILFSTPEYAGAMPGSFKNLLDWTVGGVEMSDKPSAWINISSTGGALATHESLTTVLNFTGAKVIEAACARIPVPRTALGMDGLIEDPALRADIGAAVTALLDAV